MTTKDYAVLICVVVALSGCERQTRVEYPPEVEARIAGVDHVGIGSDLRGMSAYSDGFGSTAEFRAIAWELIRRGRTNEEIGKIMGGNFFRVWQAVAGFE
jgi:hypothetical protein